MTGLEIAAIVAAGAAVHEWLSQPGGPLAPADEAPPPPGAPDPFCIANDAKLKKWSKRQWTICVRTARKYKSGPIAFPQDWRCIAGQRESGMEDVYEAWATKVAQRAQQLDPRAMEALLWANGQAFEAFGQKMKDKFKHEVDNLKDKAKDTAKDAVNKAKKALGL